MEGILWKWTNYWNGWQTRWFILDNGILSYYKSQEEVSQGCKGSIKVSVCQINISNIDNNRIDIVIPNQQHMYLRAPSPPERQKWLVALGSAKACVDHNKEVKVLDEPNSISQKKYELQLYCDLMMQQVHAVKSASDLAKGKPIDIEKLDDASSLLSSTCDTFVRTLEDIMKLANNASGSTLYELPISNMTTKSSKQGITRINSQDNR